MYIMQTKIYMYMYTCIHTYTYTHSLTHTYTHTLSLALLRTLARSPSFLRNNPSYGTIAILILTEQSF